MKHEIQVPQMGLMENVTLVEWLKAPGSRVVQGEAIASVETDKVNAELEAPAAGVLEIAVDAGPDLIPADTVLGYVDDSA